jgi:hypothetical protein
MNEAKRRLQAFAPAFIVDEGSASVPRPERIKNIHF